MPASPGRRRSAQLRPRTCPRRAERYRRRPRRPRSRRESNRVRTSLPSTVRCALEGTYGLDSILAYSAVCAGGVDTVPLTGDTSEAAIARIVGDLATLAFKWNKPLAARLLPAPGKRAGEMTEFSGALANAIIQPLPGSARR